MKKTIYILALITLVFSSCSSDDNNNLNDGDAQNQCEAPLDLGTRDITTTNVILGWGGFSSDFFQVEYGLNGFTQGNGTIVNSNDNDLLVNGLSSNTAYDFYVRRNCGGLEFSDWAGPHTFVTD